MATHARPIGVIARLLDLSEWRIQQLSREGVIPKAEGAQFDVVGAALGHVATRAISGEGGRGQATAAAVRPDPEDGRPDARRARARRKVNRTSDHLRSTKIEVM